MKRYFLIFFIFFNASELVAWGIKVELRNPRILGASLASKAIKKNEILYCLKIDPSAESKVFSSELALEMQSALSVWLKGIKDAGAKSSTSKLISNCADADLEVQIGNRSIKDQSNGAFTQVHLQEFSKDKKSQKDFILIKINMDYIWNETRGLKGNANGQYQFAPFSVLTKFKKDFDLPALLNWVSFVKPASVDEVSEFLGASHGTVFWTTYRALLHELGHGFGLCDTNKEFFESQCDPLLRGNDPQPPSIMLNSNFFYLTADDKVGLSKLFKKLKTK